MALAEQGRVHVFRPRDGGEDHVAAEIGKPARDAPVLTRLHSACFTGDVLGSLKCDCGAQLHAALKQMQEEGTGILLYLHQEGRGIGLANKMRAYSLQDQGFDTVEANHRLGFEDDERDFRTGADILKRLGFSSVRLLTNNPAKVEMMKTQGIEVVERVPLWVGETAENAGYLTSRPGSRDIFCERPDQGDGTQIKRTSLRTSVSRRARRQALPDLALSDPGCGSGSGAFPAPLVAMAWSRKSVKETAARLWAFIGLSACFTVPTGWRDLRPGPERSAPMTVGATIPDTQPTTTWYGHPSERPMSDFGVQTGSTTWCC